ncbi:MAG: hypothetical protein PHY93_16255 [Bacteriovorax sp.]|nr:hypothetical protein [Bacteriovorax sp.]
MPEAVTKKVEDKIIDPFDDRLAFVGELREGRMSLDAANSLIDFDGSAVLNINFQVSKARLNFLKEKMPDAFTGDYRDVEAALTNNKLNDKFVKFPETDDSIIYQVSVKSKKDLNYILRLIRMRVQGSISLFE